MNTDKSYAFHEGWTAYLFGQDRSINPYTIPDDSYWDWDEGFDGAYLRDIA